ncbi:hypothetical protein [Winogradskyella alexanderae]|uniref:Polysaccharide chain length determinant N-terminal domain-containing protein n=1 Tax=Winogradskyella alexanderae TaxID=2877123 RepID=A0ABS7XMP2_9FLAO|nr:hypothetical protein [Winogradskyella alexanderae]MCA0131285.1 hypothetical protein [Winogradskyella alexanderae]
MSENLKQNNPNEEVDLGHVFNAIARLFEKLFALIVRIVKTLFSATIYALKPIVNNFKLVAIVVMLSAIAGYISEQFQKPVYYSDMLVKPYFDSKYQLDNNVNYFNALIRSKNVKVLSEIFEIDTVSAGHLRGFEMHIGPETQNYLLQQYDNYRKSIDSTLAAEISYEDYIENRDILAGSVFSIVAKAKSNDIFPSLEKGFVKTFENEYSQKLKRVRDSTILIRKASFQRELRRVDSLQNVYLNILEKESDKENLTIGAGGIFPVTQERSNTREYELFKEELEIRNRLRILDEKMIEESDFYDILSGFEEVGSIESSIWKKHTLIFPIVSFMLLIVVYIAYRVFNYIKKYE